MLKSAGCKKLFFLFWIICPFFSFANNPEIVFPKDNYTTSNNTITIKWNNISSTVSYQIQISDNNLFSPLLVNSITSSNSYTYTFPQTNKTYYTRVKATSSGWSGVNTIRLVNVGTTSNKLWLTGSNTITSGGFVTTWTDVLHSNIATQSNAGNQPILNAIPLLNNLSALTFDGNTGSPDYLSLTNTINLNDFDLFVVRDYVNNSNAVQYFLGGNGNGFFSEADFAGCGYGAFNGNFSTTQPPSLTPSYSIYETQPNKNFRNGVVQPVCNGQTVTGISVNTIGTRPDVLPLAFQGNIAEIILFDTIINSDFKTDINNYLHDKYAPPVNLGTDTVSGNSFCDSITLDAGNRFVTYNWSNGSTSRYARVSLNNSYSITAKDIFGRESTDDILVYPYARLNNMTTFICQGDTFKVDLKTPAGFTALWNTGATTTKLNISASGQYTVKVTDGSGCFVYDTINVVIDAPNLSPTPDLSNNLRVCLNEKLFLVTSTAYDSIRWSTGSTDNFITITAPGPYTVYGRTTAGCIINKSFNVTIAGEAPVAKFVNSSICQNAQTAFTDSSTSSVTSTITNWKWTFGDNNTSVLKNPNNTYTNLGTYTVGFKVTTNQGCSDSISKTIIVNRKPTPSFYNLLSCSGIATTFVDQTIPNSAAVINWAWDFGLGQINGIQNPSFSFPGAGVYNVKLTATNSNGCSDTITLPTTVNASPVSNFSFDSVCGKTPVSFKFLASVASPSFIPDISWGSWDFGDGNIETAIRNPQHIYQTPGTYDVSLFVRSSDQCVDTVTKRIKVFDFPIVDFTVSQTQCTGKEIQFTDISATPDGTPLTKWNWFFSGQATSEAQNPRYAFNAQGNYTVQLTARNAVGCTGTKLRSVAISAPPTPAFTFSPQNGLPPLTVNYFNQSPVNGNYLWDYGDGSPLVEGYNPPVHIYTEKGTYPIKLIATDFRGCTDTLTKLILVDKAFLDGVMASVSIIPNGEFYKIQVSVINNSNVEITALGLSLQLGGGAVIRENWTGSLLPGQTTVYLFTGEIKIGDNGQIPVICASIDNINNNAAEDRTDNNTSCKEVAVGGFDVLSVYPNPAYEVINFGVMLPKEGRVNIRFIDILGQQMYSKDFDGLKGYNSLSISTMQLNAAVYVAEVSYDGQVVRKKFMRKDRK